ncbi:MAG TPA: methyltransferase domain-containing protein [Nocardioides sp.]|jgi:SAM-dependent methyltransferase|uniref:class I SAM-dependent methyltransferase n=1 Tax=Nocardioides sp. TaxID=35761 RepID=UPI002E35B297|nr:methyltransferase domain-containing protein [Nocardioides sp.]HEX3932575.1 methyltransferase domain-containing protein [Nocardioides sp.]
MTRARQTRWEQARGQERAAGQGGYGAHFARLIDQGADIEGEARLADALAPRGARILDAGSGMGRVGGALRRRGHAVVGVDFDPEVLEQSRRTFPELPLVDSRLDHLTPELLSGAGFPAAYDLVVCVGNVMILLAPETERLVLANLAAVVAPEGRLLVGFSLTGAPAATSRRYPAEEFVQDAASAGLEVASRFATYDLRPFTDRSTYAVHVLRHASA